MSSLLVAGWACVGRSRDSSFVDMIGSASEADSRLGPDLKTKLNCSNNQFDEAEAMVVPCFGVAPEFRRRNPFGGALFHSLLRIGSSGTGGLNVDGSAVPRPAGWSCALQQTSALNSSRIFRNVRLMSAMGQKQTWK